MNGPLTCEGDNVAACQDTLVELGSGFGSSFFVTKHNQVTYFLTELSNDGASTFLGQHFDLVDHTLR